MNRFVRSVAVLLVLALAGSAGAELTSCGTDVDSLVACVAAEVQACTDDLFLMAFPPVP